jgi:hypothetical protein
MRQNSPTGYAEASAYVRDPGKAELFRWLRWGYIDAAAGRPFRAEYAIAHNLAQRNYETGRLTAATIRAAGLGCPAWQDGAGLPASVNQRFIEAVVLIGRPEPSIAPAPSDPGLVFEVQLPRGRRRKSRAGRG